MATHPATPTDAAALNALSCVACEGIGSAFDEPTAESWSELVPEWTRTGTTSIERSWRFPTFRAAFEFAARIADLADEQGHHPDLEVGWGRCTARLTTHALGGLTENDFVLASHIDRLPLRS